MADIKLLPVEIELYNPDTGATRRCVVQMEEGGFYPPIVALEGSLWQFNLEATTNRLNQGIKGPIYNPASPTQVKPVMAFGTEDPEPSE